MLTSNSAAYCEECPLSYSSPLLSTPMLAEIIDRVILRRNRTVAAESDHPLHTDFTYFRLEGDTVA